MSIYLWCASKGYRIDQIICQHNLSIGKCRKTKNGCKVKREQKTNKQEVTNHEYESIESN